MKASAFILLFAMSVTCCAEPPVSPTSLGFLREGTDYKIEFPPHLGAFASNTSSVAYGTISDGQRFPVTTTVAHVVSVFTVRELGASQWALLEHPSSLSDAATWNLKLASAAKLTPETIADLQSTDDGKLRLAQLRKFAANAVDTSQTWVNLSHALTISTLPTTDAREEFSVNVRVRKENATSLSDFWDD